MYRYYEICVPRFLLRVKKIGVNRQGKFYVGLSKTTGKNHPRSLSVIRKHFFFPGKRSLLTAWKTRLRARVKSSRDKHIAYRRVPAVIVTN